MTTQEINIAKATSRSAGASAIKDGKIRAIVPLWVEQNIDKNKIILDFGAGKGATSTKYLLSKGFDVTAYDLWIGNGDELLDKYENISYHTCINCGKSARYLSNGWICPYCEDHYDPKDGYTAIIDENGEWKSVYDDPEEK